MVPTPRIVAAVAEKPPTDSVSVALTDPDSMVLERRSELDLETSLSTTVPTVGLDLAQAGSVLKEFRPSLDPPEQTSGPAEAVLAHLDEATKSSLPFLGESECKLDEDAARALGQYSRKLHTTIAGVDGIRQSSASFGSGSVVSQRHGSTSELAHRDAAVAHAIFEDREFHAKDAVPALVQILQVEGEPVREQLVDMLAKLETRTASQALANRAVFDLSPAVRSQANRLLAAGPPMISARNFSKPSATPGHRRPGMRRRRLCRSRMSKPCRN
jgi:hypothetical protein